MALRQLDVRAGLSPRKQDALEGLRPDVALLCELQPAFIPGPGWTCLRRTSTRTRSLGLLAGPGWTATIAAGDPGLPWLLPVELENSWGERVTVLAIWTLGRPDTRVSYATQTQQAIRAWDDVRREAETEPWQRTLLAGDLNASLQGAGPAGHVRTLQMLAERGMTSAYHHTARAEHGQESQPTLRWVGPGRKVSMFHCDYVFASAELLAGMHASVGEISAWCTPGLSDHAPVIVDFT